MTLERWLKEPLVHFFLLGAALFALYGWLNRDGFDSPDEIVVDGARVAALAAQFERTWQRPPTADELAGLVDSWVREEILYREGLALGFDSDDPVLRRRIGQKVAFISESFVDDELTDAELETYLAENVDAYRIEPRYTFRQRYFDPGRRGDDLDEALAGALDALRDSSDAAVGDPTLLPPQLDDASTGEIRRTFGARFAEELAALPAGQWAGPVRSGYGVHLVRVDQAVPGRVPSLSEVRAAVERDLLARRTEEARDRFYDALRERYTVRYSEDLSIADNADGSRASR